MRIWQSGIKALTLVIVCKLLSSMRPKQSEPTSFFKSPHPFSFLFYPLLSWLPRAAFFKYRYWADYYMNQLYWFHPLPSWGL